MPGASHVSGTASSGLAEDGHHVHDAEPLGDAGQQVGKHVARAAAHGHEDEQLGPVCGQLSQLDASPVASDQHADGDRLAQVVGRLPGRLILGPDGPDDEHGGQHHQGGHHRPPPLGTVEVAERRDHPGPAGSERRRERSQGHEHQVAGEGGGCDPVAPEAAETVALDAVAGLQHPGDQDRVGDEQRGRHSADECQQPPPREHEGQRERQLGVRKGAYDDRSRERRGHPHGDEREAHPRHVADLGPAAEAERHRAGDRGENEGCGAHAPIMPAIRRPRADVAGARSRPRGRSPRPVRGARGAPRPRAPAPRRNGAGGGAATPSR